MTRDEYEAKKAEIYAKLSAVLAPINAECIAKRNAAKDADHYLAVEAEWRQRTELYFPSANEQFARLETAWRLENDAS